MLLSCVSSLGGGYATSYGTLMVARIFQAIGISYGFVVGSAVVVDMFWQHERGQKTGIWVLMLTLGAPLGALIGGPLVQNCGWQWAMWLPACTNGAQALAFFLTYRETLYPARQLLPPNLSHFTELFRLPRRVPHSSLSLKTFLAPLLFIQSPIVVLCALAYGLSFGQSPGSTPVCINGFPLTSFQARPRSAWPTSSHLRSARSTVSTPLQTAWSSSPCSSASSSANNYPAP